MVKDWFSGLVSALCYDADIQKLIIQYGKPQNLHGDYIEE
jgi:hypothetical protein